MGYLIDKVYSKFEQYRFSLPKKHKEIFDRIIRKTAENEQTLTTMPEVYVVVVMNQLVDMEERLERLECKK